MRIRKPKRRVTALSLSDRLKLWGGLLALIVAIGWLVNDMNSCVASEVKAQGTYSAFPGLSLDGLSAAVHRKVTALLNTRYCNCGCLMSVASCRNHHTSCRTSRQIGQQLVEESKKMNGFVP